MYDNTSISPHYKTPDWLYKMLNQEFLFNDDPCPLGDNIDGLLRSWGSSTYLNPPYGSKQLMKWLNKAIAESEMSKTIVCLLPARTDTKWWHEYCMKSTEIRFIKGRLSFNDGISRSPFPSVIVIFRKDETDIPELKLIYSLERPKKG